MGDQAAVVAILALDLGTHTGWAFYPTTGVIIAGSWDFSPGKEPDAVRYIGFTEQLNEFISGDYLGGGRLRELEVLYEDVRRHAGTRAAHVYGGLVAHLAVWCHEHAIVPQPVGVGQIKKFWTGRGTATKEDMIAEARARDFNPVDDNEADALALLHYRIVNGPVAPKVKTRKARSRSNKPRSKVGGRTPCRVRSSDRRLSQARRKHAKGDPIAEPA